MVGIGMSEGRLGPFSPRSFVSGRSAAGVEVWAGLPNEAAGVWDIPGFADYLLVRLSRTELTEDIAVL